MRKKNIFFPFFFKVFWNVFLKNKFFSHLFSLFSLKTMTWQSSWIFRILAFFLRKYPFFSLVERQFYLDFRAMVLDVLRMYWVWNIDFLGTIEFFSNFFLFFTFSNTFQLYNNQFLILIFFSKFKKNPLLSSKRRNKRSRWRRRFSGFSDEWRCEVRFFSWWRWCFGRGIVLKKILVNLKTKKIARFKFLCEIREKIFSEYFILYFIFIYIFFFIQKFYLKLRKKFKKFRKTFI